MIGAVLGTIAALFVLLVVGSAILKSSLDTQTANPVAIPTFEPSPFFTQRPTESDPPEQPTRRPTGQPTRQPTENPVEPPARVTVDTSLKNNSMYRAGGLPRTNCPAGNASIFSHSQLKGLILKTGKCMERMWGPILRRQGFDWSPPGYAIAAKRGRGACGDYPSAGNIVPYYCPRNSTIYASTSAMARGNGRMLGYGQIVSWNGGIISMMAHEYGHHVQNVTGILNAHWDRHLATGKQSSRLALSRRLELQATCFGGMFMRGVASSYPISSGQRNTLYTFYSRVGDHPGSPRDHGSLTNNHAWFRQGWEKNKAFQCNTWLASSSATS